MEETIHVEHDRAAGQFTWSVTGMDGLKALGLMSDALVPRQSERSGPKPTNKITHS